MDASSVHTAGAVQKYLAAGQNRDIKVMYLPTATPELGAIEEYWHQAKRDILVSEYYATIGEMKRTLSEYLRTESTNLDVIMSAGNP